VTDHPHEELPPVCQPAGRHDDSSATRLEFQAVEEERPGPRWQALAQQLWPVSRAWYVSQGEAKRPSYMRCRRALVEHMPELVPLWEQLTELAGGTDLVARFLSSYRPPPYFSGCSQAVWSRSEPVLARNYDYHPSACEGVVLLSRWHDTRVLAMSDGLWGVLDGMNEHGLVVSLSFGGRRAVGDGFGIPLVLRYVLEFCSDTAAAAEVIRRIPTHMAYNTTLVDASGDACTVRTAPDRPAEVVPCPVATNHQQDVEWAVHAETTQSLLREQLLLDALQDPGETADRFVARFGERPLWSDAYARGFGTLYTAVYRPRQRLVEYSWPGLRWTQSFDTFREGRIVLDYATF
jgi:predicted choloylglycine hydrolase